MAVSVPSISVEYIKALVVTDVDTSSATVSFAFVSPGTEPTNEWVAASWYNSASQRQNGDWERTAQVLIGSGTDWELTNGLYDGWIKVSVGSEAIVRPFLSVKIT